MKANLLVDDKYIIEIFEYIPVHYKSGQQYKYLSRSRLVEKMIEGTTNDDLKY